MQINAWHYNIQTFLDSASLRIVNINFSSIHGYRSRKYTDEMKNDFGLCNNPFLAKMLMSAVFLAGQIPCSLNAKDAKLWLQR